jgi:hypothetical protein
MNPNKQKFYLFTLDDEIHALCNGSKCIGTFSLFRLDAGKKSSFLKLYMINLNATDNIQNNKHVYFGTSISLLYLVTKMLFRFRITEMPITISKYVSHSLATYGDKNE